jgi:moderate conductance mechanosensitive channel
MRRRHRKYCRNADDGTPRRLATMRAMLDLPPLPAWAEIALQIGLITLAALAGFLVLRAAVGIGVRHLLERRRQEAVAGTLPQAELERRVHTIGRLVVRLAAAVIGVIAVLMALDLFGIDIGPAVAGLGVVGIAVGLGAQALVRDWLAGIFIVLENQFSTGDVVRLADVEGVVEDFGLRRTTLRDLDGTLHSVPNGQIVVASNMTRVWTSISLDIEVRDESDLERAGEIVERTGIVLHADEDWGARLLGAPKVAGGEPPTPGSGNLRVLAQVRASEQRAVRAELRARLVAALDDAGIGVARSDGVGPDRVG